MYSFPHAESMTHTDIISIPASTYTKLQTQPPLVSSVSVMQTQPLPGPVSNQLTASATPTISPPSSPGNEGNVTVVSVAVGASLAVALGILTALVILVLFVRHKNYKAFVVSEKQQVTTVPENREEIEMTRNGAYTVVIATERNVAYNMMINGNVIPASQNEVRRGAALLEGRNSSSREDTAQYTQTAQSTADYSYEYVQ